MVTNLELTVGFSVLGVGYAVLVGYVSSRNQRALREFFTKQNIPVSSNFVTTASCYTGEYKVLDVTLDDRVYQVQVDPGLVIDTPLTILDQWKR